LTVGSTGAAVSRAPSIDDRTFSSFDISTMVVFDGMRDERRREGLTSRKSKGDLYPNEEARASDCVALQEFKTHWHKAQRRGRLKRNKVPLEREEMKTGN